MGTVSITLSPAVMVQRAVVLAALAPLVAAPPPDVLQPPRGATFDDIFPSDGRPERFTASRHLWESFVNHGYLDELHVSSNPGQLCDIGAADGSLTHFISRSFGMQSVAYDIVPPDDNLYSLGEAQTTVQLFDGHDIPQPSGACALTLFCYVLHHAANNTFKLLQEARRVSSPSSFVLLAEDLAEPTSPERTARNLQHDPHGIFRTDDEWRALLPAMGLELVRSGHLFGEHAPQMFYIARPNNITTRSS